jgi:recombinational DNA repair protein (RecF pathway)
MKSCCVCHFEMVLDDVAVESATGRAICLRCYSRLAETARRLPRRLSLELEACASGLTAA